MNRRQSSHWLQLGGWWSVAPPSPQRKFRPARGRSQRAPSSPVARCASSTQPRRSASQPRHSSRGTRPRAWPGRRQRCRRCPLTASDGADGVSGYQVVEGAYTIEAGHQYLIAGATAQCPAGKVITGGGSSLEHGDGRQFFSTVYEILNSGPGSEPNSWAVSFGTTRATDSSDAGDKVVATAYCIDAPAPAP